MPTIDTKGLPQLLADQAVAAQASAGRALNFSTGSDLRALAEAWAAVVLWFQAMLLRVLAASRLTTSSGEDVDSFLADYGLTRTAAAAAQGTVRLSRTSAVAAAFVPAGSLVRTSDGSQTFAVVADATSSAYDAGAGGYTIPAGIGFLDVPVAATVAGAGGNVGIGTVTLIASALAGVDAVINAAPMTGGAAAETDQAAKSRFPRYLASLSQATRSAVDYAVSQVQPGIRWDLIEREDAAGGAAPARFVVVVDDGLGSAPPSLISRVYTAVDAVRGLGIAFDVIAATPLAASVSMTLTMAPGANRAAAIARAAAALNGYLLTMETGGALPYTRLAQVAYAADASITNVSAVTLNGGTADLAATPRQVIVPGVVTVS